MDHDKPCPLCADVAAGRRGDDPWLVACLGTGVVRLARTQYFPGAVFLVADRCVREIHHLPAGERVEHLAELAAVTEAVDRAFSPRKLNVESLGNGVPHLHWWITPRYAGDPRPHGPIWEDLEFLRAVWTGGGEPDEAVRDERIGSLRAALSEVRATGSG